LAPPTAAWGCLFAVLYEDNPDRFHARGIPGGDVEKLLHGLWLVMSKLVHQGSVVCARPECRYDVSVANLREFMTLAGETLDVILQGFPLHLSATLQILGIARPHVCALEGAGEDVLEILQAIDRVSRQVIEPSSTRVG
jgi:hypothetical protein